MHLLEFSGEVIAIIVSLEVEMVLDMIPSDKIFFKSPHFYNTYGSFLGAYP